MGLKLQLKRLCERCQKPQLRFTERKTVWRWHECDKPVPGPQPVPAEYRLADVIVEPGDAQLPPIKSRFETLHDSGVERHPDAWFEANVAAVSAANGAGLQAEAHKEAISAIVLRVLDVAKRKYGATVGGTRS